MQIRMQTAAASAGLRHGRWARALVGHEVDDRGRAAVQFARANAEAVTRAHYNPDTLELLLDESPTSPSALEALLAQGSLLLEATTLGLVEIFLAARAHHDVGVASLSLVYAEPEDYTKPQRAHVANKRDFELTQEVRNFSAVPGAALLLDDSTQTITAFLVGYEGHRLEQALEQTGLHGQDCFVIFGVPAFKPGWEMNSLANNIGIIQEHDIRRLLYAGAQNPWSAMKALRQIRGTVPAEARLLIAPIGTKPHGIAAALFACNEPNVGLIYDHPVRQVGRSTNVDKWHLFETRVR